jgi:ribosomal protein L11 methyltransferase
MPPNTSAGAGPVDPPPPASLAGEVLRRLGGRRRTPEELLRSIGCASAAERRAVRAAIRALVAAGELVYTFEHGASFLEPSFDRPVRVSARIILAPPGRPVEAAAATAVVRIAPGASFGAGRHPTTRLALRGIDFATGSRAAAAGGAVLDVGTGTGVLAIAAVALGLAGGVGIDLDPVAVREARQNVALNGFAGRIDISDRPLEAIGGGFALAAANLRPPTLAALAGPLAGRLAPGGCLVLSGIRRGEVPGLRAPFEAAGLRRVWEDVEEGWAGVVLAGEAAE